VKREEELLRRSGVQLQAATTQQRSVRGGESVKYSSRQTRAPSSFFFFVCRR
jgi:hypothetical protein